MVKDRPARPQQRFSHPAERNAWHRSFHFVGTLYDLSSVGSIRNVVAPPHDIIDAAGQKALHDRHPQNIIRLELGMDEPGDNATNNRYTRAAETLGAWIARGALKRDAQPAIYYTIEYAPSIGCPGAEEAAGLSTTTKLEPLDSGHITPMKTRGRLQKPTG